MIAIIAAVAKNGVIGKEGGLPWDLPEDLKRFKQLTTGHIVLMGRKTFESIIRRNGKPLPNRTNMIVTRDEKFQAPEGVLVFHSLDEALEKLKKKDVYVIGGGQIYQQTIDKANVLHVTHVDKEVEGDVYFPEIDPTKWQKVAAEKHEGVSFITYTKKRGVS